MYSDVISTSCEPLASCTGHDVVSWLPFNEMPLPRPGWTTEARCRFVCYSLGGVLRGVLPQSPCEIRDRHTSTQNHVQNCPVAVAPTSDRRTDTKNGSLAQHEDGGKACCGLPWSRCCSLEPLVPHGSSCVQRSWTVAEKAAVRVAGTTLRCYNEQRRFNVVSRMAPSFHACLNEYKADTYVLLQIT